MLDWEDWEEGVDYITVLPLPLRPGLVTARDPLAQLGSLILPSKVATLLKKVISSVTVVSICSPREFELPADLCCPATPPPAQFNLTDTAIPEQIPRVRQRSALASGGYLEMSAGKIWSDTCPAA